MSVVGSIDDVFAELRRLKSGATSRRVPIVDPVAGRVLGRAEVLTTAHVSDDLVERFVRWRNRYRGGWLDQRVVTEDGTRRWLNRYFERPDMLLWLLFAGETLVGRTGFLDLTSEGFMTDGLVRGERGGGASFMRWANESLVRADLDLTGVLWIDSKILADNDLAIASSDALGYRTYAEKPLFRHEDERGVHYSEDAVGGVPTDRTLLYRRATREDILEAIHAPKEEP